MSEIERTELAKTRTLLAKERTWYARIIFILGVITFLKHVL